MTTIIIGYGIVGQNVSKIFPRSFIYDPAKLIRTPPEYSPPIDVGFVCVPTNANPDGSCNTDTVKEVISLWLDRVRVLCIRSTVPPGFTEKYPRCVFQPEYYGATQHANNSKYNFVILGGKEEDRSVVTELYKEVYTGDVRFFLVSSRIAELCKYMENSWLATKVTFCNEFYRIAKTFEVEYDDLRELWLADPRINPSHTFVYKNHPFYKSHCLDKDIPAIIDASEKQGYSPTFLKQVMKSNGFFRAPHDSE